MASTRAQRTGLKGVSALRRKLRNMEPIVGSGIRQAITDAAIYIEADAQSFVPKDTGDLAASIEHKISADGFSAVIGPAARSAAVAKAIRGSAFATRVLGKPIGATTADRLFQYFKGVWIEFGTKGNAEKGIPPHPAQPFMRPAFDMNRKWAVTRIKDLVDAQLKRMQEI
jgi:HK97 gp10 family phage protein